MTFDECTKQVHGLSKGYVNLYKIREKLTGCNSHLLDIAGTSKR